MFKMFSTIFAAINEFFNGLSHFMAAFSASGKYAEEMVEQTIKDSRQEAEIARKLKKLPESGTAPDPASAPEPNPEPTT
jgi:hypothetical protein